MIISGTYNLDELECRLIIDNVTRHYRLIQKEDEKEVKQILIKIFYYYLSMNYDFNNALKETSNAFNILNLSIKRKWSMMK